MRGVEAIRSAPAFAEEDATIDAPIERVWNVLSDLEQWPACNKSVSRIKLFGPVAESMRFHWVASGMSIKSRIESIDVPKRIVWPGKTMGISAIHLLELSSAGAPTRLHTEESFQGLLIRSLSARVNRELANTLKQGLGALKNEAERWHGEGMA